MDEHVGEDERHHCLVDSMTANHRMIEGQLGLVGIIEQRLDAIAHAQPCPDRVRLDRGPTGRVTPVLSARKGGNRGGFEMCVASIAPIRTRWRWRRSRDHRPVDRPP